MANLPKKSTTSNQKKIPQLTIAGGGLLLPDHLTVETCKAIMHAPAVLYSKYHVGAESAIRELNPSAELFEQEEGEYLIGQHRPNMYRRIAEKIVSVAQRYPGAVSLHPGSATLVDSITQFSKEIALKKRISVRILPGISSVEAMLSALGIEVAEGLQMVLAQYLVLHNLKLTGQCDTIVIQPGYYDTRWYIGAPTGKKNRYRELAQALGRTYSSNHPMALVLFPMDSGHEPGIVWFRLGQLGSISRAISPLHTLFIPRASKPKLNEAFRRYIDDLDFVLSRVERNSDGGVIQLRDSHLPKSIPPLLPAAVRRAAAKLQATNEKELLKRGSAIRAPLADEF